MKTYWDLSEKERSELTQEQVEKYIDAELMTKGVLAVAPLTLVDVPALDMATQTVYRIGGVYTATNVAFATAEQAQAFLALDPLEVYRDWEIGEVDVVRPLGSQEIRAVKVPAQHTAQGKKAIIKQIEAAKKENARRTQEFNDATKKVDETLRGLWDDWHQCREQAAKVSRVVETFDRYLQIAGDGGVAAKFLAQVFTVNDIVEAMTWTQRPEIAAPAEAP